MRGIVAALPRERQEAVDDGAEEPREPHRFAAATAADAIHAVVPVAGAHQRQAVRTDREAARRSRARHARTAACCSLVTSGT